jgi:hypothetical protein
MSSMRKTVLSFLVAVLISVPALAQTSVKLNASASPASGQPGVTSVSVTGSGFPSGTISPSAVTVKLTPTSGSPVTTTASSVGSVIGSTKIVGFLIPASITVSSPTAYAVTISGQTTTGTQFVSSTSSALTVNPSPSVASVAPASGSQGQTVTVTITGTYTSFAIGATQANFGAGISVGGGTAGANGPVSVTSATSATATLTIASGATLGAHNVTVVTGSQTASLANGFSVTAGNHPPVAVPGGPYSVTLPGAIQLNGSASYDPDSGDTLTYVWNFGDGSPQGSAATRHRQSRRVQHCGRVYRGCRQRNTGCGPRWAVHRCASELGNAERDCFLRSGYELEHRQLRLELRRWHRAWHRSES